MQLRVGKMPTAAEEKSTRSSHSSSFGISTIGEDLLITGNVSSKSHLQGDVHCTSLTLGENYHIEGNVTAEEVTIQGRLIGSVRALQVMLQATSHVEGDLLHKELAMEQGAYFDGASRCSEDPLSDAHPANGSNGPKPAPAAERTEMRREKSSTNFIRSLNGSDEHLS
jgi:cytoskeletal protein CcmA (bactofilin family)